MDRYKIQLKKKVKPGLAKSSSTSTQYSDTQQVRGAPRGFNFSLLGPNGYRVIIPVNRLNMNYNNDELTISNNRDVLVKLTGTLAQSMHEDIQNVQEQNRVSYYARPQSRRGRTLVT